MPVYLTHTSLVEGTESIGKDPYRYIILQLSELFTMTLLCGPTTDTNDLYKFLTSATDIKEELSNKSQV